MQCLERKPVTRTRRLSVKLHRFFDTLYTDTFRLNIEHMTKYVRCNDSEAIVEQDVSWKLLIKIYSHFSCLDKLSQFVPIAIASHSIASTLYLIYFK